MNGVVWNNMLNCTAEGVTSQTTLPTVASGGCTTNTITAQSTDITGSITFTGTCTAVTAVVITFQGPVWVNAPVCTANARVGTIHAIRAMTSTTQLTLTTAANIAVNDVIGWHCFGVD